VGGGKDGKEGVIAVDRERVGWLKNLEVERWWWWSVRWCGYFWGG